MGKTKLCAKGLAHTRGILGLLVLTLTRCGPPSPGVASSIQFAEVPEAAPGGAKRLSTISGRVSVLRPGLRMVLYAHAGLWWVQPYANQPFTSIRNDLTWSSLTHLGTEYAALLVDDS